MGMGIGDWGLGIGDWGLGPIPNPQSPNPNPPSPTPMISLNKKHLTLFFNSKLKIIHKKINIQLSHDCF